MKDNKEYLKDIYTKYEQEKDRSTFFYKKKMKPKPKILTNAAVMLLVVVFATTGVFAGVKIYGKIYMQPSFTQEVADTNTNQMWCGTFQLAWNDLMNELVGGPIEFEGYESKLATELNKQSFTSDMLSEDSYYKIWGKRNIELKNEIEKSIKEKFNEESRVLADVDWNSPLEGYVIYVMLKKEFNFIEPFIVLDNDVFGNGTQKVKYFGIDKKVENTKLYNNVEVLFYNSKEDFAVSLKTKENEDVILYRTNENTSFEDKYAEVINKSKQYVKGNKKFTAYDTLKVPYINISSKINYTELCDKRIKGTDFRIIQALQTIDIKLDNVGGKLVSEALLELEKAAIIEDFRAEARDFNFDDNFIMFLKQTDKEKPYFAIFVNNEDVLEK